jgi:3-dehydroquinate synthase class II
MTREQFLNGTEFYVGRKSYKGAETYSYNQKDNYISKQIRSSIDESVVLDDYVCNVTKVGRLGFTCITFVMKKKVVVKYKFEDLVVFE